jgi:hypothetical protein
MFIPGCIIAVALFIFTGNPHRPAGAELDPQEQALRDQDRARCLNGR